jgi:prepilin-type N-terminal cleavage/methylation domain-containing protein
LTKKNDPPPHGLTLIEVLAALVILSTLLTGLLLSKQRALRQWARADARLQAVRVADGLMTDWWIAGGVPLPAEGEVDEHPQWRWITREVEAPDVLLPPEVKARVVELAIVDLAADDQPLVLASVQVLQPLPTPRSAAPVQARSQDRDAPSPRPE